jgi:hypothetical protein
MRFHDVIGYGHEVETSPGVWETTITEMTYQGDVIRNSRQLDNGQKVNDDLSVSNSISVVADAYLNENFIDIKYIKWLGRYWTVTDVTVQPPRLLLSLGGAYNGPKA